MADPEVTEVPNPASASTLAELAHHLRVLHIHAGEPSMREISRRTRSGSICVPPSTVHDALSGKRGVPKRDNFMQVVTVLAELAGDTPTGPWKTAWNRVRTQHKGLQLPAPASSPVPAQTVPETDGLPRRIAVVNSQQGAELIESLPLQEVLEQLASMDAPDAAARLDLVAVTRAAAVVEGLNESIAARFLTVMRPESAAKALAVLPAPAAADLLMRLDQRARSRIVLVLESDHIARLAAEIPNWVSVMSDLNITVQDLARILDALPQERAADYLLRNEVRFIPFLREAPDRLAPWMTRVPAPQTAKWLAQLEKSDFLLLRKHLSDAEMIDILCADDSRNAPIRPVVQGLGEIDLVDLIVQMPLEAMQQWADRLHGQVKEQSQQRLGRALRAAEHQR